MSQICCEFEILSSEERMNFLRSKYCYINSFIGNAKAKKRLSRAVFYAYANQYHRCPDFSFAFYGPPSTGKTHLAKLFAKTLQIPFVVIEPQTIKKVHDIFVEIEKACLDFEMGEISKNTMNLHDYGNNNYFLPPMVVFIDEVHNLKKSIVHGLLKATEANDRLMITEEKFVIKTNNVCWIIATTDRGELFDAFDTRFQKIALHLYSKSEMAQIIKMNNPDWTDDICCLVSHYNSHVPREALSFAKDMRIEHMMNPRDWVDVARSVAEDHEIDEHGMSYKRLEVLRALGKNPVSSSQLPFVIHVKEEELKKYIMPPLLSKTSDTMPMVTISSKGYTITKAGLQELDKRGIENRGINAVPESMRDIFDLEVYS